MSGMISPFAGSFRGSGKFRNVSRFRARGRAVGQWNPTYLGLLSLYDQHLGGTSSTTVDSSGSANSDVVFAAPTAAPTLLAAPGSAPYVRLFGESDISCPDSAGNSVTGDFEAVWRLTPQALADGEQTLMGKFPAAPNRSWAVRLASTTKQVWTYTTLNGTTLTSKLSSAALTYNNGDTFWLKMTRRSSDGRIQIFHAADASSEPSGGGWTQLGTDLVGAVGALYDSTASLQIGASAAGSYYKGGIIWAVLRNGIDGTAVADFDAAQCGQAGYTDASGNVWTVAYPTSGLSPAVKSAAAGDLYAGVATDGTNDTATGPVGAIPAATASDSCTLFCVSRPRATLVGDQRFFSTRSGTGAGVTLRMASATTVVADVSDGSTTVTTPAVTITPGTRYVLGVVLTGGAPGTAYCFANNTIGTVASRNGTTETGGALTVFSSSTPDNWIRTHSRVHYASRASAVTAADIANLVSYYGGGA